MLGYSDILDGVLSSTIHRRRPSQKKIVSLSSRHPSVVGGKDAASSHQPPATVLTTLIRNPLSPLFPFFDTSAALSTMEPFSLDDDI